MCVFLTFLKLYKWNQIAQRRTCSKIIGNMSFKSEEGQLFLSVQLVVSPPMLQILDTKASHKHRASFRCFLLLLSNMCDIYNLNPHFKFCLIHPTKLASATFHISDRLRHSNPTIKSMGRVNLTLLVPIPDEERKLA